MDRTIKVAVFLLIFSISTAFASTTGTIYGTVTDSNGDPLPGVTITLDSPSQIGQRTEITDASGKYRAVFLTPGNYTVTAVMQGFATQKANVKLSIDGKLESNFKLQIKSEIDVLTVVADTPVIDHSTAETGASFDAEVFNKLPTTRTLDGVIDMAPGVMTRDASGDFAINGATGPENQYIIDGVNTSSIRYNTNSANLNFDFIQEVQIKTGGYAAEFGRATGGIMNVITKSGGNTFEGSVHYFSNDRDNVASAQKQGINGSNALGSDYDDFGFTLGGPIIKDRLWFFVGLTPTRLKNYAATGESGGGTDGQAWHELRGETETITSERDVNRWSAKLSWQVNEKNSITLSGNGDPQDSVFRDASGTTSTDFGVKFNSTNIQAKWNAILGNVFTLETAYSYHEESADYDFMGNRFGTGFSDWRSVPRSDAGDVVYMNNRGGERDNFAMKLGAYLGNHDLKMGFDFEDTTFNTVRDYGGQGWHLIDFVDGYFLQYYYETQNADGSYSKAANVSNTKNEYYSYFIQDSWSVTPNLVVNLGLRNEVQTLFDAQGSKYHSFDDNLAPRLGFTYDFSGDGRSKIYGHWGRYFQNLPMDINVRAASPEIVYQGYFALDGLAPESILDWTDEDVARMTNAPALAEAHYGSGYTNIDPSTKATNHDEIILGLEYEFAADFKAGFRYINRQINQAVEDVSFDGGHNYIIANPGEDISFTNGDTNPLEFFDFNGDFVSVAPGESITLSAEQVGFPKIKRDYNGYEFLLSKAFRDNWTFQASYVHSSSRGNYVGSVAPDGQVDPGITSLFDTVSTTINADGLLPQHRRHTFKFDGSYAFNNGLTLGARYRYRSGAGYDAIGNPAVNRVSSYGDLYLVDRGTAGSLPALTDIDLRLDYNFKFTGKMNLSLYADIFNVFNFQEVTSVSRTFSNSTPDATNPNAEWNAGLDAPNSGSSAQDTVIYANRYYAWLEGRFANVNEVIQWYETNNVSWEADTYGKATSYQNGRRTRIGARFRF